MDPMTLAIVTDMLKSGGGTASTFLIFGAGFLVYKKYFVNGKNGNGKVSIKQDQAYDDHIKLIVMEGTKEANNGFREELRESGKEIREEMKEDKREILQRMSENKGSLEKDIRAVHKRLDSHLNKE